MHDLALVLMGAPVFKALAMGKGTTLGPFHADLPLSNILAAFIMDLEELRYGVFCTGEKM